MAGTDSVCQAIRQHLFVLQSSDLRSRNRETLSIDDVSRPNLKDSKWIRGVIVWLEDTKIRYYEVKDREKLKSTKEIVWYDAIRQYVKHLQCPLQISDKCQSKDHPYCKPRGPVLTPNELLWVLGYAVGLVFDDGIETSGGYDDIMTNTILNSGIHPGICDQKGIYSILDDVDEGIAVQAFGKLCTMLSVSLCRGDQIISISADALSKCLYRLEHEIIPFLEGRKRMIFSLNEDEAIQQTVPLGFTTGDDALDLAARVLRILHIKDLRRLQNVVDDAIVTHQEITANPRTEDGRPRKKKTNI